MGNSGNDRAASVVIDGTPDGTVPSVFGHTRETATALLREQGLEVRYGEKISCDPAGRPVGTAPATGSPVQPGQTVTVLLSYQGATTDCAADLTEPWQFVDFATGRGPSPRFADEVLLFVDGVRTGTLSGEDAARGDWGAGSALDILDRATEQVLQVGDSYQTPWLQVSPGTPPDTWCGVARPQAVAGREALTLTIDFEQGNLAAAMPRSGCLVRDRRRDRHRGRLVGECAWRQPAADPDVIGLSLTEARDRVTAAGYPARVEGAETCHPRDGVVEQVPTEQDIEDDSEDSPGWYGPSHPGHGGPAHHPRLRCSRHGRQ